MGSGISEATQSFKDLFGKKDASATNDVLNGGVVATGTPGAKTVADPNGGLNNSQLRNRKIAGGIGGAISNVSQPSQPRGGGAQIMMPQAPQLLPDQPSYLGQYIRRSPFFGG